MTLRPAPSVELPAWVSPVTAAVAAYFALFGLALFFFPNAPFDLLGMPRPAYPWLMSLIGLFTVIYAPALYAASRDPVSHWLIIFVALAFQILVPLYNATLVIRGELPWGPGWLLVIGDALWAIPLFAILRSVFTEGRLR